MSQGELFTRLTIWIALGGYALGTVTHFAFRENLKWQARARWAWTVGCFGLLTHTICAYHYYHAWSQTSAYRETARQTAEVFGLDWGGGLYINYAFIAAWMLDAVWWWRSLEAYNQRPRTLALAWHGFFLFIVFNATVVFKTGALRWLGLVWVVGVGILWWLSGRQAIYANSKGIKA